MRLFSGRSYSRIFRFSTGLTVPRVNYQRRIQTRLQSAMHDVSLPSFKSPEYDLASHLFRDPLIDFIVWLLCHRKAYADHILGVMVQDRTTKLSTWRFRHRGRPGPIWVILFSIFGFLLVEPDLRFRIQVHPNDGTVLGLHASIWC